MRKSNKPVKDVLTRAIETKQRTIANSKQYMADIRASAEERCAKIQKNIAKQQILLDALKSGTLKP